MGTRLARPSEVVLDILPDTHKGPFAKEDGAFDVFAAYALNKNLSATIAYVDLGDIATFKNQRGVYISLQAGF